MVKRWSLVLGAAALCVLASGQAQASYQVIRWNSGLCQVWSHAIPTRPFPGGWRAVSRPYPTAAQATARMYALIAARRCGW
jgi:hypothetical protein